MNTTSKTINVANLPPVPVLKKTLIGVIDNRIDEISSQLELSTAKVKKLGTAMLALSKKCCFFCGVQSSPSMQKMKSTTKYPTMTFCSCLNDMRGAYVEYRPWEGQEKKIISDLQNNVINKHTLLFGDKCANSECTKMFTVTANMYTMQLYQKQKNGEPMLYTRETRCKACRDQKNLTVKKTVTATPTTKKNPQQSNANIKPQPVDPIDTLVAAVTGVPVFEVPTKKRNAAHTPLKVSMRDQLIAKQIIKPAQPAKQNPQNRKTVKSPNTGLDS